MTHERAQPLLLDLVYGELSPDEAREVERHAAECAPCAAELESLLATRRLAARLADEPVPSRGRAELLALARRPVVPAPSRRRVRARAYAVVASAAVVVLVAGLTLRLGDRRSALKGREVPDLHDLTPLEDVAPPAVAPPAVPGPAAKPPSPQPSPSKGEGVKRVAPPPHDLRPSRAAAPERRPSAPRSDAEQKSAQPPPAAAPPADEPPAPVRAERPSAGAPSQPLAAAPQRSAAPQPSAAPRAQEMKRFAQRPQAPPAASAPQAIVDDIERRAADGQLRQERRRLSCDGLSVERVALLDGARVVKLTIRADDGTVDEGWYDEEGRLRTERRSAPGRPAEPTLSEGEGAAEAAPAPSHTLPSWAPSPAALPRCAW